MTMKKTLLVCALAFWVSGCFHSGDPRAKHYRAPVTTVANNVCVTVQPEDDERIITIRIDEVGNDSNGIVKYDLNMPVSGDKCITDFGYKFEIGKAYNFTITLESPSKKKKGIMPAARIYNAGFTLWDKNGEWEVTTLY